ncbi:MAG TPA: CcoQ/FixQ family Cbb3-type cytochrome c oxidase assembly chaperone [Chitinophagaceae bacterium]
MFKFVKKYAESIEGINIYPMISLLIFFLFFVVLLYYVKKLDKQKVREISRIPLDDNEPLSDTIIQNNLKQV